ncbi:MAG TPA: DUF3857 domain-containing protein [Terracidiphilus sp.]|nr:DUF3857 domain-containing protein [Terracidiphilus sp.]
MRTNAIWRTTLLLFVLASSTLLRAQFLQPTPEELSMTADPKAPGAAAVFLNVEEVTDDPHHYRSFYARIKILAEKGKELATVEIPYQRGGFKVSGIEARTIHADGTVIPLNGKPEDLLISKTAGRQIGQTVFNLPSVEVGSILEYRYYIHYDDDRFSSPYWEIQRPYFVHKAHYAFSPFKAFVPGIENATNKILVDSKGQSLDNLLWWQQLPPGVSIKTNVVGVYSIDLTDIPPAPDEDWMPPIHSFLYQVLFYYQRAFSAADFWEAEINRWSREVDHFAEPSNPIKDAVRGLIAPSDSDLDKARKLYVAVQALENTDFSRQKGETELKLLGLKPAKRAEDTWSQKSGSRDDIALLYLAMLRAAGLTGYAMRVVDRDQGIFSRGYLNFDQLNDDLVILSIGGKEIVLDPGEKMCPFQALHWRHSSAAGIRQTAGGHAFASSSLQPYSANTLVRFGDVTVDPHGGVTGNFRFVINGQEALRWRQAAIESDPAEVNKRFDRWLESMVPQGVEAHIDHFLGLDDPDSSLMAVIKVQGSLGAATSRRLLLPGFFFETREGHPFVDQEKRLEPVDMHYAEQVTDQVAYHLPSGLTVEGAPQDGKIQWQDHALLVIKTVPAPGQFTVARALTRAFTFAKPEEYQDLRGFYQKVAAADQQQLVLTATPTGKGN